MPDGGLRMYARDEYPVTTLRGDLDVDVAADSVRTPAAHAVNPVPGDARPWHPPRSADPFYRDVYVNSKDVSFAARPLGHLLVARLVDGRFERDTEGTSECFHPGMSSPSASRTGRTPAGPRGCTWT
jgi:hypothetical protein